MKKLYFIVGSQDLYGEECLKQVAEDSRQMVAFLNEKWAIWQRSNFFQP